MCLEITPQELCASVAAQSEMPVSVRHVRFDKEKAAHLFEARCGDKRTSDFLDHPLDAFSAEILTKVISRRLR